MGRVALTLIVFGGMPTALMLCAAEWNEPILNGPVGQSGWLGMTGATTFTAVMGWRAARRKDWKAHGRWMTRCFGSLIGGFAIFRISAFILSVFLSAPWLWTTCVWTSWVIGIGLAELYMARADAKDVEYRVLLDEHAKKI